ncbi:MAG: hypothetical protein ABIO71_13640 [Caldimonas sp.]
MMALFARICGALLALPLLACHPFRRATRARRRAARVRAAREAVDAQIAPVVPPARTRPTNTQMRAMRDELRQQLALHVDGGRAFGHLARFERKFSQSGLRAIEEVPVDQLRRALADFEAMVRNWSSPALADLRSRMAVTLADRTSAASVWIAINSIAPAYRNAPDTLATRLSRSTAAAFQASQQMSIGEVSLSHFEAAGGATTH